MEAIRKAGLRLIFEHGYSAMSLRQLAAAVGIQAGSLYNHISTKQELLFDLVQDHVNELLRQLDRALEGKTDPPIFFGVRVYSKPGSLISART